MDPYELLRDILIPLLAPLGAAAAVVYGFLRHARKSRQEAMNSLYRDLDWTWQQYRLVANPNATISPANAAVLTEAWERVFRRALDDSEAMSEFYRRHLRLAEGDPMLLLGNARLKLEEARANPGGFLDIELLFALHNFLWLCELEEVKHAEHERTLALFLRNRPSLRQVLVQLPDRRLAT